jgi:Acetoacetate decarboxylase (ADC)
MPVNDDTAMIGGREQFGFPKKMAESITLDRDGPHVAGSVVRNGAELLRIEGEFADPQRTGVPVFGVPAADPDGRPCEKVVSFPCSSTFPPPAKARSSIPRVDPPGEPVPATARAADGCHQARPQLGDDRSAG